MHFDYIRLRARIREKLGSDVVFAARLGISKTSLSLRLNNQLHFPSGIFIIPCGFCRSGRMRWGRISLSGPVVRSFILTERRAYGCRFVDGGF